MPEETYSPEIAGKREDLVKATEDDLHADNTVEPGDGISLEKPNQVFIFGRNPRAVDVAKKYVEGNEVFNLTLGGHEDVEQKTVSNAAVVVQRTDEGLTIIRPSYKRVSRGGLSSNRLGLSFAKGALSDEREEELQKSLNGDKHTVNLSAEEVAVLNGITIETQGDRSSNIELKVEGSISPGEKVGFSISLVDKKAA